VNVTNINSSALGDSSNEIQVWESCLSFAADGLRSTVSRRANVALCSGNVCVRPGNPRGCGQNTA